jgi:hypothetical protein
MDTTKKIEEAMSSMERSIAYCNRSKEAHSRCYRPLKVIPSWGLVMLLKNKGKSTDRKLSDIGEREQIKEALGL